MKTVHLAIGVALIIFLAVVALAGALTNPSGALVFVMLIGAILLLVFLSRRKEAVKEGTWLGVAGVKAKHIWNHASRDQRSLMVAAIDLPAGMTADLFLSAQWRDLPASVQMSLARTLEEIRNEDQQVQPAKHHTTTATTGNVQSGQTMNTREYGDYGNVIKPEVISVLKSTPASTEDQKKFDGSAVFQAGVEIHEALTAWMPILRFGLSKTGTSEGDANFQMGALYNAIEQASRSYFPPVVSIAIASFLRSYVQYLTTEEGDLNCITAELAVKIICSLSTLEDGLFALLRDAGWNNEQIAAQSGELSAKIGSLAGTAKAGIVPLTLAFTMDTYAKALVSGPMGQSQDK